MINPAQKSQSPQSRGWTPERRARQSAMMRARKIWLKSTGPKTAAGKARSARNAAKPHLRRDPARIIQKALAEHGRYLADINKFLAMAKDFGKNELLNRRIKYREKTLRKRGMAVTFRLSIAAAYAGNMQKPCFSPPNSYKKLTELSAVMGSTEQRDG